MLKLWIGWCGHDFREKAFLVLFNTEYESATLNRKVGKYLPVDTASHPRRNES
jgi:hypothetical protein